MIFEKSVKRKKTNPRRENKNERKRNTGKKKEKRVKEERTSLLKVHAGTLNHPHMLEPKSCFIFISFF